MSAIRLQRSVSFWGCIVFTALTLLTGWCFVSAMLGSVRILVLFHSVAPLGLLAAPAAWLTAGR